jgi:hypothetical protein
MSTSGTYLFSSPESREFIDDAYQRIGVVPSEVESNKIITAQRAMNFILQSWANRGMNLWVRQTAMIAFIPYVVTYDAPPYTLAVLEALNRQSVRNLSGTPTASSGNAANAFDGNVTTACTQTAPNGTIQYVWTAPNYIITLIGIQSALNAGNLTYSLTVSYTLDGGTTWVPLQVIPPQIYPDGILQWFEVPVPVYSQGIRIAETAGATLNIAELYFNNNVNDTLMTGISESEYMTYPNKTAPTTGAPSLFYFNRQVNPTITVWQPPYAYYNNMFLSYTQQIQDIGQMTNNPQIPARFLEALCAELAVQLAYRYPQNTSPDMIQLLSAHAKEEYGLAHQEDRERVPIRIYGNYMDGLYNL